jgi:hypothetical protein
VDALRRLLEAWRSRYYDIKELAGQQKKSENDLVYNLDMSWRLRRLYFAQNLIDTLLFALTESSEGDLRAAENRRRALVILHEEQDGDLRLLNIGRIMLLRVTNKSDRCCYNCQNPPKGARNEL